MILQWHLVAEMKSTSSLWKVFCSSVYKSVQTYSDSSLCYTMWYTHVFCIFHNSILCMQAPKLAPSASQMLVKIEKNKNRNRKIKIEKKVNFRHWMLYAGWTFLFSTCIYVVHCFSSLSRCSGIFCIIIIIACYSVWMLCVLYLLLYLSVCLSVCLSVQMNLVVMSL